MGLGVSLEQHVVEQTADEDLSTGEQRRHNEPAGTPDLGLDAVMGLDAIDVPHVQETDVTPLRYMH